MTIKKFILASIAIALCACAGKHVRPPADYSVVAERTVRVAFDQRGDTYPRTISDVDWSTFKPAFNERNFGGAFSLKNHYEKTGGKDWSEVQRRAREDAAYQLNKALIDGGLLVVMIHGFNMEHAEAKKDYDMIRDRVKIDGRSIVFLEVYWDGLRLRNDKAISGYATFWPDALTYSNFAGNFGLRSLLNSVEKNIDLRFVTHSRGIAVALSSLIDPAYDSDIRCPGGELCGLPASKAPAFYNPRIRSIKIAAFAPAIGRGHLLDNLDDQIAGTQITFLAGVNSRDFATSKWIVPSDFWGDTSLGSNPSYIMQEQFKRRKNLDLRVGLFDHGKEHALEAYFSGAPTLTDCFFATIDLQAEKAEDCALIATR